MTSRWPCNWPIDADALTLDRFGALDLRIETKPDLTPVTDADRSAEELLRDLLAEHRPDDAVLGEEYGGTAVFEGRQWVLDPIDGTKNFVRGVPVWSTLIALLQDGVPVVGVVSAPAMQRRWWAGTGEGAFTSFRGDTRAISVSGVDEHRIRQPVVLRSDHGLGRAAVAVPRPHRRRVAGAGLRRLLVVLPGGRGRRRHRRRAGGQAVGPRPARRLGARGGWVVHQPRRLPAAPTAAARWRPTACCTIGC